MKSQSLRKLEKARYDAEYRRKHKFSLAVKKRRYYQSNAGKACSKRNREKMKKYHLEYCRRPEYRANKVKEDQIRLAKKEYGIFWESGILIHKIKMKVAELVPDKYERYKMRGVIARIQARQALKRSLELGWNYNWSHIL